MNAPAHTQTHRWPRTLFLGLTIVALCEILLFTDVHLSNRGPVHNAAQRNALAAPVGVLASVARWFAINMTALVWVGYLFLIEGLLTRLGGKSAARRRPHHFALCCLASVFIWCIFDMINFNLGMRAWIYIGIPGTQDVWGLLSDRGWGYLLAFGTIVPGMLMTGQVLLDIGAFNWARAKPLTLPRYSGEGQGGGSTAAPHAQHSFRMPHWGLFASLLLGLGMLLWVLIARTPVTNYVLWTSLVFLLDPINYWLGRPSMFRDWERGWYGRTLAAMAGGLICGFLWEFWNYWALTKWTYHLPFLGSAEHYKYFEMPLPGLLGFIPFGIECWIMWQMIRIPLDGLVEPLPNDRALM